MLPRSLDPAHCPIGSSERQLCESTVVVYVNTWQFEGYDDAKSAIQSSVLLQFKSHQRFGNNVKDGVRKLLKSANWGQFVGLSLKNVAVPAAAAFMTAGATAVPADYVSHFWDHNLRLVKENNQYIMIVTPKRGTPFR